MVSSGSATASQGVFRFGGVLKGQVQKVGLWKKGCNKSWTLERRAGLLHPAGASAGSASAGSAAKLWLGK